MLINAETYTAIELALAEDKNTFIKLFRPMLNSNNGEAEVVHYANIKDLSKEYATVFLKELTLKKLFQNNFRSRVRLPEQMTYIEMQFRRIAEASYNEEVLARLECIYVVLKLSKIFLSQNVVNSQCSIEVPSQSKITELEIFHANVRNFL